MFGAAEPSESALINVPCELSESALEGTVAVTQKSRFAGTDVRDHSRF